MKRFIKMFHHRIFLILLVSGMSLSAGCANLKGRLKALRHRSPPVQAAPEAVSPLDSVWRSAVPVDTVILEPRPAEVERGLENFLRLSSAETVTPGKSWGFRVQLASSAIKKELEALLPRVAREFETRPVIEEQEGRYSLRIGAFSSREAAGAERLRAVSYGYKNAWIVQTQISLEDFQPEE